MSNELSHKMFKMSTVGWYTCLQSFVIVCQWLSSVRQTKLT